MIPTFQEGVIYEKYGRAPVYSTASAPRVSWPSLRFYACLLAGPFSWLARRARAGKCDDYAWTWSSAWVGDILESCGCQIHIEGLENLPETPEPVIYVANHMSTLETFLFPAFLRPRGKVTFVVKTSLTTMPLFGAIMRSRNPIAVERKNPREDLAKVLEEGKKNLENGISLVIFPQSTRSLGFSREHFNSLGVKLAKRGNAPVIPIALKTDAWGLGRPVPELGKIRPDLPVRIRIGRSIKVTGNGKTEHEAICDFIETNLLRWQKEDGINK